MNRAKIPVLAVLQRILKLEILHDSAQYANARIHLDLLNAMWAR